MPLAETMLVPLKEFSSGILNDLQREQDVWELASILFDKLDFKAYTGLPRKKAASFEHRLRKDDLSRFWQKLCKSAARDAYSAASSAEERAIAHLTANRVSEACEALLQGKDYRLAVLAAQLGDNGINREDIASQIEEWRKQNMLSEMTEPIRALYELLAGNTCKCEGKRGPLEDRARTFVISERFDLDWERAFGLRLWYAIGPEDPLEVAVQKFAEDLESGEVKKPLPGFVDERTSREPQDKTPESRDHILWGLLKLYAGSKTPISAPTLADTVDPMNTIGHPLGSRLSFQLYHLLALHFPQSDHTKADQITWDFATQLESTGDWVWALFAILHLSNPQQRKLAIQSLLAHHASDINDGELTTLNTEFQIPAPWIWEAKALLSRSKEDAVGEVEHLLRARNWTEAHAVLCRAVGPQAVIEQDYATLQELLQRFEGRNEVEDWGAGGQIYEDFVALVHSGGGMERKAKSETVGHLLEALPVMGERADIGFEEGVAIKEMSAVVAKAALELAEKVRYSHIYNPLIPPRGVGSKRGLIYRGGIQGIKKARVLDLPLTQEARLQSSAELSVVHYRVIMAGGK